MRLQRFLIPRPVFLFCGVLTLVPATGARPTSAKPPNLVEQQKEDLKVSGFETAPKTKEELDPQTRRRFEELRADLAKAEQAFEQAVQQSYVDDPLRSTAKRLARQASDREQELKPQAAEVRAYFEQLPPERRRQARRLNNVWGEIKDYEVIVEMAQDPKSRPFVSYFAELTLAEVQESSDPLPPGHPYELMMDLLPKSDEALTPDESLDIYLTTLKGNHDRSLKEYNVLKQSVEIPAFVRRHTEEELRRARQFILYDTYFRMKQPAYISTALEASSEISRELYEIWPRWRWAETPEEIRNPPKRVLIAPRPESEWHWWLIVVNIAVFGFVVLILLARSLWRHRASRTSN